MRESKIAEQHFAMRGVLFYFFCAGVAVTLFSGECRADPAVHNDGLDEIRAMIEAQNRRIDALEKENLALRETVERLQGESTAARVLLATNATEVAACKWTPPATAGATNRPPSVAVHEWLLPAGSGVANLLLPLSDRGVRITPYGYVKLDMIYNDSKTDGDDYSFYVRPPWARGAGQHETTFSLRESRLGIDMAVPELENGYNVSGKFEIDFFNGTVASPLPRFRQVYVEVEKEGWSLLAGATWDAWWEIFPSLLDGGWGGGCGHPYHRRPQLRLSKRVHLDDDTRLTFRVAGVQNCGKDLDDDTVDDGSSSAWPMIQGAAVLEKRLLTQKFSKFSLSGSYGKERLTNEENPIANKTYLTDLLMVNALFPIFSRFSVSGSLYTGENLDTYKAGISQGINETRGTEIAATGGWVQGTLNLFDPLTCNVGYTFEDCEDGDLETRDRSYNERYYLNFFYSFTDHVRFAVEYCRLATDFLDAGTAYDNQYHAAIYYFF